MKGRKDCTRSGDAVCDGRIDGLGMSLQTVNRKNHMVH